MKIRNGFVSNSSSSSFVLLKSDLSPNDIKSIRAYLGGECSEEARLYDHWNMHEDEECLSFFTTMDNGYFKDWLKSELHVVPEVEDEW